VRGVVEMGRYLRVRWWRRFGAEDRLAVDDALESMQLSPLQDRQISALSGGQQQRVFLARALAQEAHVLLLDEPFTGLDQPSQDALRQVFRQLRERGKLLLISHHELSSVPELFDRVVLLNGELIAAGTVAEAFTRDNLTRAYGTRVFSRVSHGLAV
jgi:ABC-type Mn2+/Zn2+ transport system ATPase subunit